MRTVKPRTWRGEYRDADGVLQTASLVRDRAASLAMLRELEVEAERGRAGLVDPFAEHARTPLADHLRDYGADLAAGGRTDAYVNATLMRVRRALLEGCGFRLPRDVTASALSNYLAERRRDGLGIGTSNAYLTAGKGFGMWMVKNRRSGDNVLGHLSKMNPKDDVLKERRDLPPDDFARLLSAAAAGPDSAGLSSPQRALLYRTAALTGLRSMELASLTPRSFDFDAAPPIVTVAAGATKNGKTAQLPLHADLAGRLREYVAGRLSAALDPLGDDEPVPPPAAATAPTLGDDRIDTEPLWPSRWAASGHAAEMLRGDLAAAGIPQTDAAGRDFAPFPTIRHALRRHFITTLANSGVHPKDAQALARHSCITLTMNRDTHTGVRDMGAALASVPAVGGRSPASGAEEGDVLPSHPAGPGRSPPDGRSFGCRLVAGPGGDGRGRVGTRPGSPWTTRGDARAEDVGLETYDSRVRVGEPRPPDAVSDGSGALRPEWRNGRREGFKILFGETRVRVRVPPPALCFLGKRRSRWSSRTHATGGCQ